MALRIPTLALYKETEQKRILEMSRIHSTIIMILVERLFLDATKRYPLR